MTSSYYLRRASAVALAKEWTGPQGVTARRVERRKIGVEAFLRWCYREELPKCPPMNSKPGEYGFGLPRELVDISNKWGLVPDFNAKSWPHPDAVRAALLIEEMAGFVAHVPEDWDLFEDMPELGDDGRQAVARAIAAMSVLDDKERDRLRSTPARLLVRHALLGGAPDWVAEMPERKAVCHSNGRPRWFRTIYTKSKTVAGSTIENPVEVDGFDTRSRRPFPDAYQKSFLDPDPADIAMSRAEYEIWHAATGVVVAELNGCLEAHELEECERPNRPWVQNALAVEGKSEAVFHAGLPSH